MAGADSLLPQPDVFSIVFSYLSAAYCRIFQSKQQQADI